MVYLATMPLDLQVKALEIIIESLS
jgi:hypothetical protein